MRTVLLWMICASWLSGCAHDGPVHAAAEPALTCDGDFLIGRGADLRALKRCRRITGSLVIANSAIEDVSSLSRLVRVDGDLVIAGNSRLGDLRGLGRLRVLGGRLVIIGNTVLSDASSLGIQTVHASNSLTDHVGLDGSPSTAAVCALHHHRHPSSSDDGGGGDLDIAGIAELPPVVGLVLLGLLAVILLAEALDTSDERPRTYVRPPGEPSLHISNNPALCDTEVSTLLGGLNVRGFVRAEGNNLGC